MKIKLLYAILGIFTLFSIGCLLLGFYKADLIFIAAGVLLSSASGLLFLEMKKILSNPFEKG
ncbi:MULTISPECIES: hypothetical protein [Acinetobacter]|jgi:hypothetical protein|uniref:Lipoprotein n=2 Tax=Acinetobacter TaxID=469 RepID=A0A4V2DQB7_9GAMM|nr:MULTISPECIES: hypothetical protein [Acinetobacter]MCW8039559.1 hypothetical protein [Acinetobacter entericus]QXW25722.1 hypothetical protein KXJ74_15860 [Acinetobacter johnsonii]RZG69931.1 hypothetical protein EXE25_01225 [Acinetobacter bouvetii]